MVTKHHHSRSKRKRRRPALSCADCCYFFFVGTCCGLNSEAHTHTPIASLGWEVSFVSFLVFLAPSISWLVGVIWNQHFSSALYLEHFRANTRSWLGWGRGWVWQWRSCLFAHAVSARHLSSFKKHDHFYSFHNSSFTIQPLSFKLQPPSFRIPVSKYNWEVSK